MKVNQTENSEQNGIKIMEQFLSKSNNKLVIEKLIHFHKNIQDVHESVMRNLKGVHAQTQHVG